LFPAVSTHDLSSKSLILAKRDRVDIIRFELAHRFAGYVFSHCRFRDEPFAVTFGETNLSREAFEQTDRVPLLGEFFTGFF
jgi:hypothetical protein